jgi:hypothetical protein
VEEDLERIRKTLDRLSHINFAEQESIESISDKIFSNRFLVDFVNFGQNILEQIFSEELANTTTLNTIKEKHIVIKMA